MKSWRHAEWRPTRKVVSITEGNPQWKLDENKATLDLFRDEIPTAAKHHSCSIRLR